MLTESARCEFGTSFTLFTLFGCRPSVNISIERCRSHTFAVRSENNSSSSFSRIFLEKHSGLLRERTLRAGDHRALVRVDGQHRLRVALECVRPVKQVFLSVTGRPLMNHEIIFHE